MLFLIGRCLLECCQHNHIPSISARGIKILVDLIDAMVKKYFLEMAHICYSSGTSFLFVYKQIQQGIRYA